MLRDGEGRGLSPPVEVVNMTVALGLLHIYTGQAKNRRSLTLFLQGNSMCGDCGSTVLKVLCYKSEGHWFDPNWCHWIFH